MKLDSGYSVQQERNALVCALLSQVNQIRGLIYKFINKLIVVLGIYDVECCYLMTSPEEAIFGPLKDEYHQNMI
jgi:hypothetical protein